MLNLSNRVKGDVSQPYAQSPKLNHGNRANTIFHPDHLRSGLARIDRRSGLVQELPAAAEALACSECHVLILGIARYGRVLKHHAIQQAQHRFESESSKEFDTPRTQFNFMLKRTSLISVPLTSLCFTVRIFLSRIQLCSGAGAEVGCCV